MIAAIVSINQNLVKEYVIIRPTRLIFKEKVY